MAASAFATAISLALGGGGVVSLNLCTDELLLTVARPEQIASLSHLSHRAEETAHWRAARRFPANDGTMLSAAALRPRLILTMGASGRDRERLARSVGARLITLPYPQSPDDVAANLIRIGSATGNERRARAIANTIRAAGKASAPPQRDAVWVDGAGRTFAPGGLGARWLALAGLRQRAVAGDRVTLEMLLANPPAVLLRSDYRALQVSSARLWQTHPAARRARVGREIVTDGRRWTCMGPSMLPEIMRLRGAFER